MTENLQTLTDRLSDNMSIPFLIGWLLLRVDRLHSSSTLLLLAGLMAVGMQPPVRCYALL